jgi:tRNA U34 5-methylaminomethyl-2-thiouridine-forming methyltransferase MnmC
MTMPWQRLRIGLSTRWGVSPVVHAEAFYFRGPYPMAGYTPPPDLVPLRTADGSFTLQSDLLSEQYHSRHGAVIESTHVYIKCGLAAVERPRIDVLEVGLGTGLNMLLTWIRCMEGKCMVAYTALEPFPLEREVLERLDHSADLAWPGLHGPFLDRLTAQAGEWSPEDGGMSFRWLCEDVREHTADNAYDVVYFDAFSPRVQPELWTVDVFRRMYTSLRPGGVLVTYCAKGEVRRSMQGAGFTVERLPGPPGKTHMLRATKRVVPEVSSV